MITITQPMALKYQDFIKILSRFCQDFVKKSLNKPENVTNIQIESAEKSLFKQ